MATIPFGGILLGSIAAPLVAFSGVGEDWRTRLTINTDLLGGPVLGPLAAGKGIVFPYTPTLFVQHNAAYGAAGLTHTNYDHPTFESHQIGSVQITGQFTANSSAEADYLRGVLHFLRTVTKMFFGQDAEPIAGTPPPVLRLNASGDYIFANVPVVVESFSMELPSSVDYIRTSDGKTMIPTSTTVTITAKPTYTRIATSKRFGLKKFASGGLLGSDSEGGFI
jgi:hypothetical protein